LGLSIAYLYRTRMRYSRDKINEEFVMSEHLAEEGNEKEEILYEEKAVERKKEHEEELFESAVRFVSETKDLPLSTSQRQQIYGLYKCATQGRCVSARPSVLDMYERGKWESWNDTTNRLDAACSSSEEIHPLAKQRYVELVFDIAPQWTQKLNSVPKNEEEQEEDTSRQDRRSFGQVCSLPVAPIHSGEKDFWYYASIGDVASLTSLLNKTTVNINDRCVIKEQQLQDGASGMTALQYACDRGHIEVVQLLLQHGAEVNVADDDGMTALHYACCCDHEDIVKLLLQAGAQVDAHNKDGETAADMAENGRILDLLQPIE